MTRWKLSTAGLAALLVAAAALAQEPAADPAAQPTSDAAEGEGAAVDPTAYDPDDPWLWGDVAVLRGLDKVTAETRDFEAPVGEDVRFFALTINVKRCAKRPPEHQPETIVGMEIFDRQTDGAGNEIGSARIFSGWMFGSSPGLNSLEHPVYDVWVLDCRVPEDEANAAAAAAVSGAPASDPAAAGD